jgi:hypothetical protein
MLDRFSIHLIKYAKKAWGYAKVIHEKKENKKQEKEKELKR